MTFCRFQKGLVGLEGSKCHSNYCFLVKYTLSVQYFLSFSIKIALNYSCFRFSWADAV